MAMAIHLEHQPRLRRQLPHEQAAVQGSGRQAGAHVAEGGGAHRQPRIQGAHPPQLPVLWDPWRPRRCLQASAEMRSALGQLESERVVICLSLARLWRTDLTTEKDAQHN